LNRRCSWRADGWRNPAVSLAENSAHHQFNEGAAKMHHLFKKRPKLFKNALRAGARQPGFQ
jgi:hypothetical protein